MKVQKNIYEMTDRELRIYKKRLRHQIVLRRRIMMFFMTCCFIIVGTISYTSITSSANTGNTEMSFKYYTNITVEHGETLWEIADRYIDYDQYQNKEEYIDEVRNINHLDAEASIKAGQYLVVPYYSCKFVQ